MHQHTTGPVQFSASGRYLLTIHPAYAALVWDLESSSVPPVLLRPDPPPALAETGRDGAISATLDPNSPLRLRLSSHAESPAVTLHPSSLQEPLVQAWFDATDQYIILEYPDHIVQVWHAETGLPVTPRFKTHSATEPAEYMNIHFASHDISATDDLLSIAELYAAAQLDDTGGWRPLSLNALCHHWIQLNSSSNPKL